MIFKKFSPRDINIALDVIRAMNDAGLKLSDWDSLSVEISIDDELKKMHGWYYDGDAQQVISDYLNATGTKRIRRGS